MTQPEHAPEELQAGVTLNGYVNFLYSNLIPASRKFGSYLPALPVEQRVTVKLLLAVNALLAQLLVSKGVFTDAELQAAVIAATGGSFVQEPPEPTPIPVDG